MRYLRAGIAILSLLVLPASSTSAQTPAAKTERQVLLWKVLDSTTQPGLSCADFSANLEKALTALPMADFQKFALAWDEWWTASYRWDLWGAAAVINRGADDEGFDQFRGWLLTRGSAKWKPAARDPDTAFDDVAPGTVAKCKAVIMALPNVWGARLPKKDMPDAMQSEPTGKPWKDADLPARFPHLSKRFGHQ